MSEFIHAANIGDVTDPGKMLVEIDGEMIALFHVGGSFYAIDDVCTHDGGPLVDGDLQDYTIACPRHGAKFDIRTGSALSMPAIRPTLSHDVKVEDGSVFVRIRETGSGPNGNPMPSTTLPATTAHTNPPQTAATNTRSNNDAATETADRPPVEGQSLTSQSLSEDLVRELLKQVKDPELFVNIVDLGLIYDVSFSPSSDESKQLVSIDMTMTSPACPAGPQLIADTKRVVGTHEKVADVEVRIVMEPPWTPDRMTDDARDQLGIF
ncbi:MAG: Rieske 2Fe-2S domain-containing protein [Planctomycetota bacterium]|nr:Rieske 2Fe-2S domain-containing protein [Planctomycetota bacterium]